MGTWSLPSKRLLDVTYRAPDRAPSTNWPELTLHKLPFEVGSMMPKATS
jgi:hypothetical protein